jgi:hypothetical protein
METTSLTEVLHQLNDQGYRLADADIAAMPSESIQSNDWRLDQAYRLPHSTDTETDTNSVYVIAVSSTKRLLKLIFVEVRFPQDDFSPLTLLRRLFPRRRT